MEVKKIINTSKGPIKFEEKEFQYGVKTINKKIAKKNLIDFKKIMEKNNIEFILGYGSLLGAIRENDFISYDEDVDVLILDKNKKKFLESLFDLIDIGFEVGRYDGELLSIMRNGEYIDIYFFRKGTLGYLINKGDKVKEKFLYETMKYEFLGEVFTIPKDYEGYLKYYYGNNWRIPIKNFHAPQKRFYERVRAFLRKYPLVFSILSKVKKYVKN